MVSFATSRNICEGRNNAFAKAIRHAHPTIWHAVDSLQKDQAMASTLLPQDNTVKLYHMNKLEYFIFWYQLFE